VSGPVIIRGVVESVRVGLPIMFVLGIISAWMKGRITLGWELRVVIAAIIVVALSFGCRLLLQRWRWLSANSKIIEVDHA
jgi:hypothetical protein